MEIVQTCPLGSECEEVKEGEVYRCRWYINIVGKHPQSNESVNQWDCSMAWLPTLSLEVSKTNRSQTSALESFRNEMVNGQDKFNKLLGIAASSQTAGGKHGTR